MEEKKDKNSDLETDIAEATLEEAEMQQTALESQETEIEKDKVKELEKLQAEVEAARDRMLRTAAEFENYKKRAEREKNEFMKYIATEFVADLLPIMDNLERAIDATSPPLEGQGWGGNENAQNFASLREGVKLTYKQLQDVLTRRGVTRIEAVGKPFDPNVHEAVMQAPSDKYPENIVAAEFQKGYMLHDRVIRAAMVSVSAGNPPVKKPDSFGNEGGKENE
ncbi:nucleotide exchange factor GrpE [Candidatus Poribacteria bacterium]|nr:nucleotide exchange factor GrpE [Candidatus Poribacteria bacterium]